MKNIRNKMTGADADIWLDGPPMILNNDVLNQSTRPLFSEARFFYCS